MEILTPGIAASLVVPANEFEFLDASSADAEATEQNARFVWVAEAGVCKVDYIKKNGTTQTEVVQLQAGWNPIRRVIKLYRYYKTGPDTAGTVKAYKSDGTLVTNAIKLRW